MVVKTVTTGPPEDDMERIRRENDEHMATLDKFFERMEFLNRPNYYAVLPAPVRYDKNLTHLEKILFAEISSLAGKDGYCYKPNSYFAEHYYNSERTISRAITRLMNLGYIFCEENNYMGRNVRKIYIVPQKSAQDADHAAVEKGLATYGEMREMWEQIKATMRGFGAGDAEIRPKRSHRQKCLRNTNNTNTISTNNTSINNTNTNTKSTVSTPPEEGAAPLLLEGQVLTLPTWLGKHPTERLAKIYDLMWESHFKVRHVTNIASANGAILKKLMLDYGECMTGLIIILFFEWRGTTGGNDRILDGLKAKAFPIPFLKGMSAQMAMYINNYFQVKTEGEAYQKVLAALVKLKKQGIIKD